MKNIAILLLTLFTGAVSADSGLVAKIDGSCQEIRESFSYIEKNEIGGSIKYEEYEGVVAAYCDQNKFTSAFAIFIFDTNEEALSFFNMIEEELVMNYGEANIALTQRDAEIYYMTISLSAKPGTIGTHVSQKWGSDKNNLEINLNQSGKKWSVVVSFGKEN